MRKDDEGWRAEERRRHRFVVKGSKRVKSY